MNHSSFWLKSNKKVLYFCLSVASIILMELVFAHGVAGKDAAYLQQNNGLALSVFTYLGAKHMVTGYDHLLYLCGVIFFLNRLKDVALFVSLFAIGHSITLLWGVLGGVHVNPYIVDAIIGLSVVYKALENLDGLKQILRYPPDPKIAVFCFGLVHGLGLSTKLQDFSLSEDGLIANIIAFNVGVEIGQLIALICALFLINAWRIQGGFYRHSRSFNFVLIFLGLLLAAYQVSAYYLSVGS
ncbi:MAG: HupE/UreJ family protein [Pseudomonadota bacterium]|nr:HupE/UreJ family protein [Pseudomonadota bacterium]